MNSFLYKKNLNIFIFLIIFFSSTVSLAKKDYSNNKLLCPKLLWGFEFISSDRVRIIKTDKNKKTFVNEYYYDVDLKLSYINIFSSKNNIRDRIYSIELNSLRIDVWAMTGGGFTTREMFPTGLCKFVEVNNLLSYVEGKK